MAKVEPLEVPCISATTFRSASKNRWFDVLAIVDALVVLLANGLRVRTIRPVLTWFWFALTRSPALFSPPLSSLAAIILAVAKREAIVGALARTLQVIALGPDTIVAVVPLLIEQQPGVRVGVSAIRGRFAAGR